MSGKAVLPLWRISGWDVVDSNWNKDSVVNEFQEGDQTSIAYLWRQTPMQTPVNTDGDDYYNIILIQMNNIDTDGDGFYNMKYKNTYEDDYYDINTDE